MLIEAIKDDAMEHVKKQIHADTGASLEFLSTHLLLRESLLTWLQMRLVKHFKIDMAMTWSIQFLAILFGSLRMKTTE
jgi:hypothetical protein